MKKLNFRKWLSAGIASVIAGTMIGTMATTTASATTYVGDVNGDGYVQITDVVALNRFLAGQGVLSDYTVADTNANYVIDNVDAVILQAFLIHSISSLPYLN